MNTPASGPGRPYKRAVAVFILLVFGTLAVVIGGCRTAPPMVPADLEQPGWTIHRGQALWQSKTDAPELAGRLLIASNKSGEDLVRFSKDPMEIVLARRNDEGWTLEIPAFDKSFSGRSQPPRRIGWFQFADAVFRGTPGPGWEWSGIDEGHWELTNRKTGERLEGFFSE